MTSQAAGPAPSPTEPAAPRTAQSDAATPEVTGLPPRVPVLPAVVADDGAGEPLDAAEIAQLNRLRRWGTVGALLMMLGASSSYAASTENPNPMDGVRVLSLLTRIGPAALALSYSGIGLIVLCWFLLGRLTATGRPRRMSSAQLWHTVVMWTVPLCVPPPLFSRDVYSYLAIGAQLVHGANPYHQGPAETLGIDNPVVRQVDGRWQNSPTPYGPAFLLIMRAVAAITGNQVYAGVLLIRLLCLAGVALIVWALPRLARRVGMNPVAALWLGALNPLVLFHLIAGAHNEAIMVGAMLAGLELALSSRWIVGTALMTVGVGIKFTAVVAIGFFVLELARRRGGRPRDLGLAVLQVGAVAVVTFAVLTVAAGQGLGWISGLTSTGSLRSFMSIMTSLGVLAGAIGEWMGLGDHTAATVDVLQWTGLGLAVLIALPIAWWTWRGRMPMLLGLSLAMVFFVLLGPVIQPWYLLWAICPLAAAAAAPRYRRIAAWLTVIFSLITMPNGATIPVFTIFAAVVVGIVVVGLAGIRLWRTGLPSVDGSPRRRAAPAG